MRKFTKIYWNVLLIDLQIIYKIFTILFTKDLLYIYDININFSYDSTAFTRL